jgi:hypothetical protein
MRRYSAFPLTRVITAILLVLSITASTQAEAADPEFKTYLPAVVRTIPDPLGDLVSGWYLLVDDGHIQARDVQRIYHPFKKYTYNPIMRADKSWEGKVIQLYGTVLPGFRMWYSTFNFSQDLGQVLYAESQDGISWSKPNVDGLGRNILLGGQIANLPSVLHTPNDEARPYKLLAYQNKSFNGYWSLNGTSTQPYTENPLFSGSDIAHFYWDSNTGLYRGTSKEAETIFDVKRRVIRFIDSEELVHWTLQPDRLVPDINDDTIFAGYYPNFYGLPVFPIGEQYLGMLWILRARDKAGLLGKVMVQMVSSHDGVNWIREEGNRVPILDVGPPGAWDDGQVYTSNRPVKVGDELWLYYSGCNQEHGSSLAITVCSIGLAKAGYNRLASLTGTGTVLTEVLDPGGSQTTSSEARMADEPQSAFKELHLNYDGSEGEVLVELLAEGLPISGYEAESCLPLTEDSYDQVVAWSGGTALPETPFQIRFYLQDSSISAFALGEP